MCLPDKWEYHSIEHCDQVENLSYLREYPEGFSVLTFEFCLPQTPGAIPLIRWKRWGEAPHYSITLRTLDVVTAFGPLDLLPPGLCAEVYESLVRDALVRVGLV